MNIQELNFLAFGPFSERILDFSGEKVGLHIIYGPNEAGKSSSLRGLKALLYGIPSRTNDNFLHTNKNLRIAGKLCNNSGHMLEIVRRKGNANTLLNPAGDVLDDAALNNLMQGVNAEIFDTLFGIDHEALVLGGQEILEQKGEVGQALFSASIGSASLHHVLEMLEEEAAGLFRTQGSKQEINALIKEYSDIQKDIKAISLSSRDWMEKSQALDSTTLKLETLRDELKECKAHRNRLQRVKRALLKLAQRTDLLERLSVLGEVVLLADDFESRRQEVMAERSTAQTTARNEGSNLGELCDQLNEVTVNELVLDAEDRIEILHSRLGGHNKAMSDRPRLEAQRNQLQEDASTLITSIQADLTLEHVETLRPVLKKRLRITELGNDRKSKIEKLDRTTRSLRDTEKELEKAVETLAKLPDSSSPDSLKKQISMARKLGDVDGIIETVRARIAGLDQKNKDVLATLAPLWTGALKDFLGVGLPRRESIDRFAKGYSELNNKLVQLQKNQTECTSQLRDVQRQLDEIENSGSVPTEQELTVVRSVRDKIWSLLRRQWIDGDNVESEALSLELDQALPEAFQIRLEGADEVADRLRREASRVQNQASQLAVKNKLIAELKKISSLIEKCTKDEEHLSSEWRALWLDSGIVPLTPDEMRPWLEDMQRLQQHVSDLNQERVQLESQEDNRLSFIQSLQNELTALAIASPKEEKLEPILMSCEDVIIRLDSAIQQRSNLVINIEYLEEKIESDKEEVNEAKQEFDDWTSQWASSVSELGLGADALPSEADQTIQDVATLFDKITVARDLGQRIEGIDLDATAFEGEAGELATRVAADIAGLPVQEIVPKLKRLLADSKEKSTKRLQLEEQVLQTKNRNKMAEETIVDMDDQLRELCEEAACQSIDDLEDAEKASSSMKRLRAEKEVLENELRDIGEGLSLEDLEIQAEDVDLDALPGEIDALTQTIEQDLEPQQALLAETKGEQQSVLRLMDGKDDAAALAEKGQSVLEEIRTKSDHYARVKIAARILRDEIERYRQENQGPILQRASEHFAALTLGSFGGLKADFDEKDNAVLVGIRSDESRVDVEGMSSGTRDQLYLALRLASIEKYLDGAEPMPFIVDDILVHFDDERSQATLGVLANLAEKTQVMLFTHHRRLVEQAENLTTSTPIKVHEL